jgi:biopolymer transport protein ExbD
MRTLRLRDTSEEATFELNLAPMMDMLVTIIPFMLLSTVFIQMVMIDTSLPVPVAQALAQDRADQKREVSIVVNMDRKSGFSINVKNPAGPSSSYAVAMLASGEFDYKSLHTRLVQIKQMHPKVFRLELNPADNIDYEFIVKTMDSTRDMSKEDPKITIDGAETPLLFPDVVLSNVMG